MELEIFTLADFAQDSNTKLTIVGTFDSIYAPGFPATHPNCYVASRMRFGSSEIGEHEFKLTLTDSDGKEVIQPITGNINVGKTPNGQASTINIIINFTQLQFSKEGRYSFQLFVDGEWRSGLGLNLYPMPSK